MIDMLKFWKWLYFLSEKKIRQCHLEKHHNDMLCPNCAMWFSISGLRHTHEHIDGYNKDVASMKCGQCKHVSHWNMVIAPVLILSDKHGTPLEKGYENTDRS